MHFLFAVVGELIARTVSITISLVDRQVPMILQPAEAPEELGVLPVLGSVFQTMPVPCFFDTVRNRNAVLPERPQICLLVARNIRTPIHFGAPTCRCQV